MQTKAIHLIGDLGATDVGGWFRDAQGVARYRVRAGDTLGNLAQKYLGAWGKYTVLWAYQSEAYRVSRRNDVNYIVVGDVLAMPPDAIAAAVALNLLTPEPGGGAPAQPPTLPGSSSPSLPVPSLPSPGEDVLTTTPPEAATAPEAQAPPPPWLLRTGWFGLPWLTWIAAGGVGALVAYRAAEMPAPAAGRRRAPRRRRYA